MYAVKATDIESLQWGLAIEYILDRMDDAAQDTYNNNTKESVLTRLHRSAGGGSSRRAFEFIQPTQRVEAIRPAHLF